MMILRLKDTPSKEEYASQFTVLFIHFRSLSSLVAAFSFALKMHFLLLTTFTVCHALHDCLFSIEFLILSNCLKCIWIVLFGMCWLVLSELFQVSWNWHLLHFFYWVRMLFLKLFFFLITNDSHGTLFCL